MSDSLPEIAVRALREYDEDREGHDNWSRKVDGWYRAWRGVLERRSEAASWRHQQHPPYILQIIETLTSGLSDPNPRWSVQPRWRAVDPSRVQEMREGAKQLEALLRFQRDQDNMILKQRPHRLQGVIAGLTVWKPYWDYRERVVRRKQTVSEPDEYGIPLLREEEIEILEPVKDDPCVEVVDVRDFIWPESAKSLADADRVHHRAWLTFDELKRLEKEGIYKGVDQLKESRGFGAEHSAREQEIFQTDRSKNKIEVVEHWINSGRDLVTIANRKVLLRHEPNPYDHGKYPFITCSPIPDLFRIPGVSIVELVWELQEMLWTLQNQRLDNLELVNNAIFMIRDDVLDPNSFVFAPGAQWLVSDKDAVTPFQPDVRLAEVSLNAEQMVKADLQNIPGASPALLGQSDVTEQTATEVSLLTNLAQRRLAMQKHQFTLADVEVGHHWIDLNRQYLSEERYVSIVGPDGEEGFEIIRPDSFRDFDYFIKVEQMDESLIRQERLAEATSRLQVALQALPAAAAIGQPINLKAYLEDVLDATGVQDKERYFSQQPQPLPAQAMAGGGGGQPGIGTPGPVTPGEGTAPQAVDMNSPSNQFSQSPASMMQQLLAMGGGPSNA